MNEISFLYRSFRWHCSQFFWELVPRNVYLRTEDKHVITFCTLHETALQNSYANLCLYCNLRILLLVLVPFPLIVGSQQPNKSHVSTSHLMSASQRIKSIEQWYFTFIMIAIPLMHNELDHLVIYLLGSFNLLFCNMSIQA